MDGGELLARRALQLMDEGNLDEWEQTMEPDCEFIGPGVVLQGRDRVRELVEGFRVAFPDVQHTLDSVFEDADTIIIELTFAGTHNGPLRTPTGEIPPTGKRISVRQAQLVRLRGDKAVSLRSYFDRMEMMAQLGLLPPAPGAAPR